MARMLRVTAIAWAALMRRDVPLTNKHAHRSQTRPRLSSWVPETCGRRALYGDSHVRTEHRVPSCRVSGAPDPRRDRLNCCNAHNPKVLAREPDDSPRLIASD